MDSENLFRFVVAVLQLQRACAVGSLRFQSMTTLGGELLKEIEGAEIQTNFLIVDKSDEKRLIVGMNVGEPYTHEGCIGYLDVDDASQYVEVIYGDCRREPSSQMFINSTHLGQFDGVGENATILKPSDPLQLSDGSIQFTDSGYTLRFIHDKEVTTSVAAISEDGGHKTILDHFYLEEQDLHFVTSVTGMGASMVYLSDFSQYVFLGTDEVFEGSLIGIDQFDHNLVWTYLPFGLGYYDMNNLRASFEYFAENPPPTPPPQPGSLNFPPPMDFYGHYTRVLYSPPHPAMCDTFAAIFRNGACTNTENILSEDEMIIKSHPNEKFRDQLFISSIGISSWLYEVNIDNGTMTKLCIHGNQSVDTDNPEETQCEILGDVTAMVWKDETTLLIYENGTGFREAKFIVGEDDCADTPCENSGTCTDSDESYSCICTANFTGLSCTEDVTECSETSCNRSGSCTELQGGGIECMCDSGYTGEYCDRIINDCVSNPCSGNTTCIPSEDGFLCDCTNVTGRFGNFCQKEHIALSCDDDMTCHTITGCVDVVGDVPAHSCKIGWSGAVCDEKIDVCQSAPCLNNGACIEIDTGYLCDCSSGFTGARCEEEIEQCGLTLCGEVSYEEKCINIVEGGLQCICDVGESGDNCTIDESACHPNPCQHHGTCISSSSYNTSGGRFTCECTSDWSGQVCAERSYQCSEAESHCINGDCYDLSDEGMTCICREGWTGTQCTDLIATEELMSLAVEKSAPKGKSALMRKTEHSDFYFCSAETCGENGECQSLPETQSLGAVCVCKEGYTGASCGDRMFNCLPNPCLHEGSCSEDKINGFRCDCTEKWFGPICQNEAPQCDDSVCSGHGVCEALTNGTVMCDCSAAFSGPTCSIGVDICNTNSCLNGGICAEEENGSFACICEGRWEGRYCEEAISACTSVSCGNHGNCSELYGEELYGEELYGEELYGGRLGYECMCEAGWTGEHCDINKDECQGQPCSNGGECIDETDGFRCQCNEGFTGETCGEYIVGCMTDMTKDLGDTQGTAAFDILLSDGTTGILQLPPGDYAVGHTSREVECPDIVLTVTAKDHYRVTTNVTSEVCSPPLRNKQSKEFKAFAKRFSQSVYKEMGDVVIEVDIKSVICGSLIVDFEIVTQRGEGVEQKVKEKINNAVAESRMGDFAISPESLAFAYMPRADEDVDEDQGEDEDDIPGGSVWVNMTIEGDSGEGDKLFYKKRGKFVCTAYLEYPFTSPEQFDGISLAFSDLQGREYEDGCLKTHNLMENKTFFNDIATMTCPLYSSDVLKYSAEMRFDITEHFIGALDYRCVVHTKHRYNLQSTWRSSPVFESAVQRVVGVRSPVINLTPLVISGYQGENITVDCSTSEGYPFGNANLSYSNGKTGEEAATTTVISRNRITANIRLSKAINGQLLTCTDSEHKQILQSSHPIRVTYFEVISEQVHLVRLRPGTTTFDCAENIETNGMLMFRWIGAVVPPSQSYLSKIRIYTLVSRGSDIQRIKCIIKLIGDPMDRQWNFTYILTIMKPAPSIQELFTPQQPATSTGPTTIYGLFTILLLALLLIMIIGYIVMKKKIRDNERLSI